MDKTVETAVDGFKTSLTIGDSLITSMIGFSIVFFVLIVLMFVIAILRSVVGRMNADSAAAPAEETVMHAGHLKPEMVPATGSLGEVKLHDVDDTTAAMLMAIVANELDAPLNELRFISIREKK